MDAKTQALGRLIETLSPALAAELDRLVQETREALEQEFESRLQAAVREAETKTTLVAEAQFERAAEKLKEETRNQVARELEQQFDERLEAATARVRNEAAAESAKLEAAMTQVKNQAAEERSKVETAMTQQKTEWTAELDKLEDQLQQWRTLAETNRQLAEASSQPEMLSRFLKLAEPFADGLALYVMKADGLALWKSKGKGAFPEVISKQMTDPESYFRIITVRGKTVCAICAAPSFKAETLEFLAGSLERAIEVFGLKLRSPKAAGAEM
jgi:exonuclease VII large subunit